MTASAALFILPSAVAENGAFALTGIGRHVLRVTPAGRDRAEWFLKSVVVDGLDVTDAGHDLGSSAAPVVVTVSNRMSSISGRVSEAGKPTRNYAVAVFPSDRTKWTPYSRLIRNVPPNEDGGFAVRGLPAGEYVAVAVPTLEQGDETDPDRLAAWLQSGRRVVREGAATDVTLELRRE